MIMGMVRQCTGSEKMNFSFSKVLKLSLKV